MINKNKLLRAEAEKAALFVESAKASTRAERELNDFVSHTRFELGYLPLCRPLSFVNTLEVHTEPPLANGVEAVGHGGSQYHQERSPLSSMICYEACLR
jgi:hypothetical protein